MVWDAPSWSLASPQFIHGFPRRLVAEAHGGFIPGNITVGAKASNLSLRRLAVCDVACLVSRGTISGTGLSKARLLNLRYAAIRYHRRTYIPQYLMAAMVEFGVNFSTFQPLDVEALEALSASLTKGWREEENEESSESYEEHLIACGFSQSVMQQIGKTGESAETGDVSAETQGAEGSDNATLSTMLAHFAQLNTSDSESELEGSQAEEVVAPRASRARAPSAGRKRRSKSASVGGEKGSKAPRREQTGTEQSGAGNFN